MKRLTGLALCAAALFLSACGGGGTGGDPRSSPAAVTTAGDKVSFSGPRSNYSITRTSSGYTVADKAGSDGSTNVASSAKSLVFTDVTINLSMADKSKSLAPADLKSLIELYIAYFNRVPDADGLSYWIDQFNAGQSLEQIGQSFYAAAIQFSTLTGYSATMSNSDFVSLIYKNVLARSTPDTEGLNYWTTSLGNGSQTRGTLIKTILSSAHTYKGDSSFGFVADLLDNKYTVASYVSVQQGLTYNSATDSITKGMAIAAAVTATDTAAANLLASGADASFSTASSAIVFSGTVASGAPMTDAVVTLTDNTSRVIGTATVGTDGSYSVSAPGTAAAPFVLTARSTDLTRVMVSVFATASSSVVNITPITNLIAARLSRSGDPSKLAQELAADVRLLEASKVAAKKQEVLTALQAARTAVGDQTDPLTGTFSADSTGHDRLLDILQISIQPAGSLSNIEVSVRQQLSDDDKPTVLQFTSSATSVPALAPVSASTVIANGTSALFADLSKRLTACFALPASQRVSAGTSSASVITASACKGLFLNGDPTQYLKNGSKVGPSDAYSEIFDASYTGSTVLSAVYQYTNGSGDLVFSYTFRDPLSNTIRGVVDMARRNGSSLQLIGNQYKFPGGVAAFMQSRIFVNQANASYYSSGYAINVSNITDSSGKAVFAKVVATTPTGDQVTLVPSAGSSFLPISSTSTTGLTNFLRLARAHFDSSVTVDPATRDLSLVFTSKSYSDAEMTAMPNISSWRLDYYLASAPTTIAATQYYRTLARPFSIAEFRARSLASLTDANILSLKQSSVTASRGMAVPAPSSGGITANWQVPSGALAPSRVTIFGFLTNGSYNDFSLVSESTRSTSVICSIQSSTDAHCSKSGSTSNYAPGYYNNVQLNAVDDSSRTFSSHYALYTVQ